MGTHQSQDLSQDARRHEGDGAHHQQRLDDEYRQWRDQHLEWIDAQFDTWKRERQGQAFADFHEWRSAGAKDSA